MIARRRNRNSLGSFALGLMIACVPARVTLAQHQSVDPYDPYGAPYRPFAFPVYRSTPDMYGRFTAPGGRGAAAVMNYFDADLGLAPSTGRASLSGVPYYQAYRLLDEDFDRLGRFNEGMDEEFDRALQARDRAYVEAMREADPVKRARKLREVDQMDLRTARDYSTATPEQATRRAAEDRATSGTRRSAGAAPPPSGNGSTPPPSRRSATSSPAPDFREGLREGVGRRSALDRPPVRGLEDRLRPRSRMRRDLDSRLAAPRPSRPAEDSPAASEP